MAPVAVPQQGVDLGIAARHGYGRSLCSTPLMIVSRKILGCTPWRERWRTWGRYPASCGRCDRGHKMREYLASSARIRRLEFTLDGLSTAYPITVWHRGAGGHCRAAWGSVAAMEDPARNCFALPPDAVLHGAIVVWTEPMPPSIAAVVVAAGRGLRAGGSLPKQYRPILGATALRKSLALMAEHEAVTLVQPVIHAAIATFMSNPRPSSAFFRLSTAGGRGRPPCARDSTRFRCARRRSCSFTTRPARSPRRRSSRARLPRRIRHLRRCRAPPRRHGQDRGRGGRVTGPSTAPPAARADAASL